MPKASLVILLGLALLAVPPGAAQEGNDTAPANETSGGSATAGNETAEGGGAPAPPEPVRIVLTGHGEGGSFFFRVEGESRNNPRLTVAPGAEVTVVLKTVSGAIHNFCTDATGTKTCTPLAEEGDEASVTFTAPESGTFEYWCDPHRGSGMRGQLAVGTAGGGDAGGDDGEEQFSGETADLGDLGYDDCRGKKIPAAAAQKAVGGPTITDYVAECRAGKSGTSQARPAHPVDYVIPGSIVLIGLGIAGVVWVSRGYKP